MVRACIVCVIIHWLRRPRPYYIYIYIAYARPDVDGVSYPEVGAILAATNFTGPNPVWRAVTCGGVEKNMGDW